MYVYMYIEVKYILTIEGSLEIKTPTIWTNEAVEMGIGRKEKETEEKKSEEKGRRKKIKVREKVEKWQTVCFPNLLWLRRIEKQAR